MNKWYLLVFNAFNKVGYAVYPTIESAYEGVEEASSLGFFTLIPAPAMGLEFAGTDGFYVYPFQACNQILVVDQEDLDRHFRYLGIGL